ncbi:hypothetical protein TcasGA2_TC034200 [Tribolium castaneum]|uniref:Uncharacterized protein n=2 Tax=Tribolium castaneum TaxID=7070 RepID=A0A139WCT4_TRICA|nr:PREDICTED: uncharacterized protein LOC103314152 [Tribolium castaneum]XP_015838453.1 PREDICTED: uncharacterized protein LOC103314152 [Tribolium castaneum]KYB25714.1 hypothetical protein TcasGA2_TC034200 [Tribolium castaneum]|eukprot:XP_008197502.1 PREDICTED: uncharacterized protein LOC103314152 [Tribolium castaneum]
MMYEKSLAETLKNLCLDLHPDPFPTKTYKKIVLQLKKITTIMEEVNERNVCCISDILTKISDDVVVFTEISEMPKNWLIPSVELCKMLTQWQVPKTFNSLLQKLLAYIVIKLSRCTSEDAASILNDFKELKVCIFTYRKNSIWNNTKLDEIIEMFVEKLIKTVKELKIDNCEEKFHLFSIMRIMITEFGKHSVYSTIIVRQLTQEVKRHYEHLKENWDLEINDYVLENFRTHLFILNNIIGTSIINIKESGKDILTELKTTLCDEEIQDKMCAREAFLVQNILRIVYVYLSAE